MNVRLVAYRPAVTTDTVDTTYQLDLQEAPNIALNFQFSDIKEPDTRKSSYSQTFKLPFTDNNNKFFQEWYNVNISTLVYDTRTKFNATLYVGTVPQFEGSLQLKGVYQKAGVYEVVLMSNTADLFSVIGESKLRDALKESDGEYSAELNHQFNETQMLNSWNGGSSSFVNAAGTSLRDTDVDVQKVMYPMSVTQPEFYWDQNSNRFLDMTQADINNTSIYPNGTPDCLPYMVSMFQFRPSIQVKTLLKLIIQRAGFRYTSAFIDGAYFGKVFMTTGNHLGESTIPTVNTTTNDWAGNMTVGNQGLWGLYSSSDFDGTNCTDLQPKVVAANTILADTQDQWNEANSYFTKGHPTQTQIAVRNKPDLTNVGSCNTSYNTMVFDVWLQDYNATTNTPNPDTVYDIIEGVELIDGEPYWHFLDLSNMPVGASCQIMMRVRNIKRLSMSTSQLLLGGTATFGATGDNLESFIQVVWDNYSTGIYNQVVNIPMCIDSNLTQKDFLKDIIQRFNLVILSDPDDSTNLLIEPYNDYLADSSIKDWTKKLDLSKEVVIKDTTSLQKKNVKFSDLEDVDMVNKAFKEEQPELNVWGHTPDTLQVTNNQFATGDLKNDPICSPYINQVVYRNEDTAIPPYPVNMVVQYEHSYKKEDDVYIPVTSAETKPKLFWYNGTATAVRDADGGALTYNLHTNIANTITAYTFTTYPVCTPYDITPSSDAYTLTPTNKSLYWWNNPPVCGGSTMFNYYSNEGTWTSNTLYGLYWKPYLDNIYSTDARIMECHLNLSEVDVFNFKFNDEIFIKDTYWRILNISNYQVGAKASTKVTMLKVIDALNNCSDCNYVLGYTSAGSNLYNNYYYLWCPEGTPNCTPDVGAGGLYTDPSCCECVGGEVTILGSQQGNLLYGCTVAGSLPIVAQDQINTRSILGQGTLKSIVSNKFGGLNNPFVRGVDNTKYSKSILPNYGDDIVIKYKTKRTGIPQLKGESHRFVLSGYTEGNTRSYAYPEGTLSSKPLLIPSDTNNIIRVKGTATVVGGSSSNYPIGTVEGFAYYTAFKNGAGGATQLGTAGGVVEFALKESSPPTSTCTLYIDMNNDVLRFGLDDSQTDTKRIWALSVELDINRVSNFSIGYGENWALYQNGQHIQFQNGDFLIWN
tara:strand:+ start:1538 stop:4969 length:3432 start_codon:yes stop_codon:yes gene_type:complete